MTQENVLVIGQGAREHALCESLAMSPLVGKLWASPGNPGIASLAEIVPASDVPSWVGLAEKIGALTIVGPEVPLADGLTDALRERGLRAFGPSRSGSRLESSKIFAKHVMEICHIPTARSLQVNTLGDLAEHVGRDWPLPVVIKEDGLAQGKGVTVVRSQGQWQDLLQTWTVSRPEGPWLIEEYLEGREVSVEVFTNGRDYVWLPPAVDHKRLTPDPGSPNTGGMGGYSPVPWLGDGDRLAIDRTVLEPLMAYLQDKRIDYRGVLYVGLMMTSQGPRVLEFNVRFGDPETEVILPLLADDLYAWCSELAEGRLLKDTVATTGQHAVGVVMASEGYPDHPKTGRDIVIARQIARARIFHAGTAEQRGNLISQGGRVLTVVGVDETWDLAREAAYRQIAEISMPGAQFRHDIAEFSQSGG